MIPLAGLILACHPIDWPEPFSVWDACTTTAAEDPLTLVDRNADGLLTHDDVDPGTAVMIAEIRHPDGRTMTTLHIDDAPSYIDNGDPNALTYSPRMRWSCDGRPGVFPVHDPPDDAGSAPAIRLGVDFAEREVVAQRGTATGTFLVDIGPSGGSGELLGTLDSGPMEDLFLQVDLSSIFVEHYAFHDIEVRF